jgi:hypothetical protein
MAGGRRQWNYKRKSSRWVDQGKRTDLDVQDQLLEPVAHCEAPSAQHSGRFLKGSAFALQPCYSLKSDTLSLKLRACESSDEAAAATCSTSPLNRMNRTGCGAWGWRTSISTVRLACCTGGYSA